MSMSEQPTWCFKCGPSSAKVPSIRYGQAQPIMVGRNGTYYEVTGTLAWCDHCGHEWKMYTYPPNGC